MKNLIIVVMLYLLLFKSVVMPVAGAITFGILWSLKQITPDYVVDDVDVALIIGMFIGISISLITVATLKEEDSK